MSRSLENSAHLNVMPVLENKRVVTNKDGTITLHIPISFKRHGGRKYLIAPGSEPDRQGKAPKESLLKALVRGFRWQEQLDNNTVRNAEEIARKEGITESYVLRVLRMAFLAPEVVEAILDNRYPVYISLADILKVGYDWRDQRKLFGIN